MISFCNSVNVLCVWWMKVRRWFLELSMLLKLNIVIFIFFEFKIV